MYTINHSHRRISVIRCSWDSPSSGQSVMPEIQINEEKVLSDVHGTVELDDASEDQKIT